MFCVNSKRITEFGINKFYAKNESSKNFRYTITLDKSIAKMNFSEIFGINIIQVQDNILNKNLIRKLN